MSKSNKPAAPAPAPVVIGANAAAFGKALVACVAAETDARTGAENVQVNTLLNMASVPGAGAVMAKPAEKAFRAQVAAWLAANTNYTATTFNTKISDGLKAYKAGQTRVENAIKLVRDWVNTDGNAKKRRTYGVVKTVLDNPKLASESSLTAYYAKKDAETEANAEKEEISAITTENMIAALEGMAETHANVAPAIAALRKVTPLAVPTKKNNPADIDLDSLLADPTTLAKVAALIAKAKKA